MNWEKVKTFLIVLFFAINVFLVGFMLNSVKITSSASKTVIDDTVAILTANNINITNEQIPYSIVNPGTFYAMPITVDHSYTSPKELNESNIEGELKKAIDSYEFALEMEPDNADARSCLATAYVAHGDFELAIEESQLVLDQDENNASALATIAICHGVLGDEDLRIGYTQQAVDNGYKEEKINSTIDALKKRFKK